MATPVLMPKQGITVEECTITQWHKKKGESVKAGEILFSYETDKASFDAEAPEDGTVLEVFYNEGDIVPVLVNVCVLGKPGEDVSAFSPSASAGPESVESAAPTAEKDAGVQQAATAVPAADAPAAAPAADGHMKISPRARNLAETLGVDVRAASPTGPGGRVIEQDIRALQASGAGFTKAARDEGLSMAAGSLSGTGVGGRVAVEDLSAAPASPAAPSAPVAVGFGDVEKVKLPSIRRSIAKAMMASLSGMAQLTLNLSYDMTDVLAFRARCKASGAAMGLDKVTINDIVLYAVSRTLPHHRDLNAHLVDDHMLYHKHVHLGIAVDTDRGLLVPTLFNADVKSLKEISAEAKALAAAAQSGSIAPDLLRGGTFTVTNIGALGIESFTPVINPPQTGILGVNTIEDRIKVVNGEVRPYKAMNLSLTFDHRALDGAPAARFLKQLKENLENFSLLLAKG